MKQLHHHANTSFSGIRAGEKIHEEMITSSDSRNTLDCGNFYNILSTEKMFNNYLKNYPRYNKVSENFNYSSGENEEFLTVEEIRDLIRKILDSKFNLFKIGKIYTIWETKY